MQVVTKEQMKSFIDAQPDDKPVDMGNNWVNDRCGCVMVQYGLENGIESNGCGYNSWNCPNKQHAELKDCNNIFVWFDDDVTRLEETTFKELKEKFIS